MEEKSITNYFIHKDILLEAASVPLSLGGENHIYLLPTLIKDEYNVFTGELDNHLTSPGEMPPVATNPHEIVPKRDKILQRHAQKIKTYKTYNATDTALQNILTNTFEDKFLLIMRNMYMGYTHILTCEVLAQLHSTYGKVSPAKVAEVDAATKKTFGPSLPIEHLVKQIENEVHIAGTTSTPYTVTYFLSTAYNLIQ
eukprot:15366418-Ditylum_brightwellii.AAC.2